METIQQRQDGRTITERLALLEKQQKIDSGEIDDKGNKKEKSWRPPFKWMFRFTQSKRVANSEKILVMMFNKKNQIEAPKFMPIYGNIIVYKDKVYKYNPKDIWTLLVLGKPQVYCIKEIDMEPITNRDLHKIRLIPGRSTEYHKLLLQAAVAAKIKEASKPTNWIVVAVVIAAVIGVLIWFFAKG